MTQAHLVLNMSATSISAGFKLDPEGIYLGIYLMTDEPLIEKFRHENHKELANLCGS